MTLRLRLLLGYGYLVALLLLSTGSALLGFVHLSEIVDVILEDNFASVRSAMAMMEALERQDSATLAALIEGRAEAPEMSEYEAAFLDALGDAEANVTEGRETETLTAARDGYEVYRRARDRLLAAQPERPLRAYNREVFPPFTAVKSSVFDLLEINHRAMIEADRETREAAVRNGAWLGMLVTVALVSLVLLSRALKRRVLTPVDRLRRGMEDIAGGDLDRRLSEREGGELGAIAGHFNRLLDLRQRQSARLEGRLRQERRIILALARHVDERAVLYDLAGRRLAGDGDLAEALGGRLPEAERTWLEGRAAASVDEDEIGGERVVAGRRVRFEPVAPGAGAPVAWLARPVEDGAEG